MTWWCNVSPDILQNATLAALQCSQEQDGDCVALCPNPDISGIGVRSAFYIQSFMNSKSLRVSAVVCLNARSDCQEDSLKDGAFGC